MTTMMKKNPFFSFFFFLMNLLFFSMVTAADQAIVKGCPFDGIYNFGDTSQSNGLTVLDNLASAFHLPIPNQYPNNYKNGKFGYGLNFGVAGATALSTSTFSKVNNTQSSGNNNSLRVQLNRFRIHLKSICSNSRQECSKKLQRTLFFIGDVGINDYNYLFFQGGKTLEEMPQYVPKVVETMKDAIRRVIHYGARTMLVSGILPIGCLPSYLTKFHHDDPMHYDTTKCLNGFNTFARLHNDHLRQALVELRLENPHVNIVYADYYNAFMALLHNPLILGFERHSVMKACCGSGGGPYNFDATKMCGDEDVPVCSYPRKYIHWDGIHLTEDANSYIVEGLISDTGNFIYPKFKLPERLHCLM